MNLAEEAEVIFATGYRNAEQAGVTNSWVYPLRCWLASAMRRQAEKSSHWSPNHRAAVLKRASKVASKALGVARKFQNDLPHALRETGLIAAMQGSVRQAKKHLDESLAVAELQGAR